MPLFAMPLLRAVASSTASAVLVTAIVDRSVFTGGCFWRSVGFAFGFVLQVGEFLVQGRLHAVEHLVCGGVQVLVGFVEAAGVDVDAGEMDVNTLPLDIVASKFERDLPGGQGLVVQFLNSRLVGVSVSGLQRFDAVVALRQVRREEEIFRVQFKGFAIERHGFVKDLGFGNVVVIGGVPAEEVNGGGEVLVVDRLGGIKLDGFRVIGKRVGDGAVVAIPIGQVVPGRRIFGVQLASLLPMFPGALFVADIAEEAAVG